MTFKHIPEIGSVYRNSTNKQFRVIKVAHAEHDPWIEYENIETKEHYSCKLLAFLDRYRYVQPYRPWLTQ